MNRNSNMYSVLYASIMVILVAGVLASVSLLLKEKQQSNIDAEKKQNLLAAAKVSVTRDEAIKLYDKYFAETYVVDTKGDKVAGVDAFGVDMSKEMKKTPESRLLPVFVFKEGDATKYVVPIYGNGMWGPIWGYLSFNEDKNTVYGAIFDHASETPGLGAEITTKHFQEQFGGKKIFDEEGQFKSITLVKGGTDANNLYGVDAVSGGTVTSRGLTQTLKKGLSDYEAFFKK